MFQSPIGLQVVKSVIFLDINLQSFKMKNEKWWKMMMIIVFKRHLYSKTMYHFFVLCLFENFLNLNHHQWIGIIFCFAKSKKQWSMIVVRKVRSVFMSKTFFALTEMKRNENFQNGKKLFIVIIIITEIYSIYEEKRKTTMMMMISSLI